MDAETKKAIETVLDGFDNGTFTRDISHDTEPGWGVRLLPYVRAIAVLAKAVGR